MRRETIQSLNDILVAAKEIREFAGEEARDYLTDRRTALAIERLFITIGEALIRIRDTEPTVLDEISGAFEIIGFRNSLGHGYDQINANRVAVTILNWVPVLISDVHAILRSE